MYIKYSNILINCTLYNLIWGQINIIVLVKIGWNVLECFLIIIIYKILLLR